MLIADFYTKPLQGRLFRLFRNLILNIDDGLTENFEKAMIKLKQSSMSVPVAKSTLQECVGENVNIDNKENMSVISNSNALRKSYSDVCRNLTVKRLADKNGQKSLLDHSALNDTRKTVYNQHPALLVKLNNVANACTAKTILSS